ncbi:NUDIX domain-containing protein [Pleionea sp. CnH1-48]|uniref:NUDIX hydrolase n=1 Tax=Pleionea sp. CnH1-48 TaxID=2954494 RepID=UPI0020979676|nr:NUDIX domain-containing protein [Pleionea sp. CnH1-48]MCO7224227.1 NUDIX domain-containing protein [Pleionea sp. CnH1-48]
MNKACPVILRKLDGETQVLAFTHPLAGNQLIKGTVELEESLEQACKRELKEESGIAAHPIMDLGTWNSNYQDQVWGFCLMKPNDHLPDSWSFFTEDDGGHLFQYFWQPLHGELDNNWHPLFVGAINFLRQVLAKVPLSD